MILQIDPILLFIFAGERIDTQNKVSVYHLAKAGR